VDGVADVTAMHGGTLHVGDTTVTALAVTGREAALRGGTTAVLIGLGSISRSLDTEMAKSYPLDLTVTTSATGFGPDAISAIRKVDGVADVTAMHGGTLHVGDTTVTALAVTGREAALRGGTTAADERFDGVDARVGFDLAGSFGGLKDTSAATGSGLVMPVEAGSRGGKVTNVATAYGDEYGTDVVAMRPAALARLLGTTPQALAGTTPRALWIRAADGANASDLQTAIISAASKAGMTVTVAGDYDKRSFITRQVRVISVAVVGLLGVAVVIALIGVGNTLGLSVVERTRENSLLRAMGLTRGQLRATLAWEGVLLSLAATLIGIVVGVGFALVGVEVLIGSLSVDTSIAVPWAALVVMVVVAVLAGVVASLVPSRRAAQISPAAGLSIG
uniref:ABC transporter permease n=1 Tax=Nocardioides sp. TaxID=35761 RepID=UPI002609BBB2